MRKLLIMFPIILLVSGASSSITPPKIITVQFPTQISLKIDSISKRAELLIPQSQ